MPSEKPPALKNKKAVAALEDILQEAAKVAQRMPALRDIQKLSDGTIRDLIDGVLKFAYIAGSSDVHIDPTDNLVTLRFRIDGILHDVLVLPKKLQSTLVTRIKVLAELRTDEHMATQDGRFRVVVDETGAIIQRSAVNFGDSLLPKSVRKAGG